MITYRRTQSGIAVLSILGVADALAAMSFAAVPRRELRRAVPGMAIAAFVTAWAAASFWRMTVSVDDRRVSWRLGVGWLHGAIDGREILSCAPERTSGLTYGIRSGFKRTLLIVSGRDAIAIRLRSGKVISLGTSDPAGLYAAIDRLIARTSG